MVLLWKLAVEECSILKLKPSKHNNLKAVEVLVAACVCLCLWKYQGEDSGGNNYLRNLF